MELKDEVVNWSRRLTRSLTVAIAATFCAMPAAPAADTEKPAHAVFRDGAFVVESAPNLSLYDINHAIVFDANRVQDLVQDSDFQKLWTIHGLIILSKGSAVRLSSSPESLRVYNFYSDTPCRISTVGKIVEIESGHVAVITRTNLPTEDILEMKTRRCSNIKSTNLGNNYRLIDAEFDTAESPIVVYDKTPETQRILEKLQAQQSARDTLWSLPKGRTSYHLFRTDSTSILNLAETETRNLLQLDDEFYVQTKQGFDLALCEGSAAVVASDRKGILFCNFYSPHDDFLKYRQTLVVVKSGHLVLVTSSKKNPIDLLKERQIRFRNVQKRKLEKKYILVEAELDTAKAGRKIWLDKDPRTHEIIEKMKFQQKQRDREWKKSHQEEPDSGWIE